MGKTDNGTHKTYYLEGTATGIGRAGVKDRNPGLGRLANAIVVDAVREYAELLCIKHKILERIYIPEEFKEWTLDVYNGFINDYYDIRCKKEKEFRTPKSLNTALYQYRRQSNTKMSTVLEEKIPRPISKNISNALWEAGTLNVFILLKESMDWFEGDMYAILTDIPYDISMKATEKNVAEVNYDYSAYLSLFIGAKTLYGVCTDISKDHKEIVSIIRRMIDPNKYNSYFDKRTSSIRIACNKTRRRVISLILKETKEECKNHPVIFNMHEDDASIMKSHLEKACVAQLKRYEEDENE